MAHTARSLTLLFGLISLSVPSPGSAAKTLKSRETPVTSQRSDSRDLWSEPADIATRNLYYGPGGEEHQPKGSFTFVEEDLAGSNPKYIVRDRDDVKWTIKLGLEAQPETVASRLVWAAGYFSNEDYYLDDLKVAEMPAQVKRGRKLIGPEGTMHAARLKRHMGDEKTLENWQWRSDPFTGTRELNGLKVMMALINNWDLKDVNNKLYAGKDGAGQEYVVSDLGASFGTTGLAFPFSHSKGDLKSFVKSKFITRISDEFVDFRTPSHPAIVYAYWPPRFMKRVRLDDLVHNIPREDARWIGHLLSGLSPDQIRDAFRAAGYTPDQVEGFTRVVQGRIAELNEL